MPPAASGPFSAGVLGVNDRDVEGTVFQNKNLRESLAPYEQGVLTHANVGKGVVLPESPGVGKCRPVYPSPTTLGKDIPPSLVSAGIVKEGRVQAADFRSLPAQVHYLISQPPRGHPIVIIPMCD